MSATLESFLARVYVDQDYRESFLRDPRSEAVKAGLSPAEVQAVMQIDQVGLELFVASLQKKRQKRCAKTEEVRRRRNSGSP